MVSEWAKAFYWWKPRWQDRRRIGEWEFYSWSKESQIDWSFHSLFCEKNLNHYSRFHFLFYFVVSFWQTDKLAELQGLYNRDQEHDHSIPKFTGVHNGDSALMNKDTKLGSLVAKVETQLVQAHDKLHREMAEAYLDEVATAAALGLLKQTQADKIKKEKLKPAYAPKEEGPRFWGEPLLNHAYLVPEQTENQNSKSKSASPVSAEGYNPTRDAIINGVPIQYTRLKGTKKFKAKQAMQHLKAIPGTKAQKLNIAAMRAQEAGAAVEILKLRKEVSEQGQMLKQLAIQLNKGK
jgi:hypothetical protein